MTLMVVNSNSCDRVSLSILPHSACLNQVVHHPLQGVSCSMRTCRAGEGWDGAGTGGRPGWVKGRVTVGLSEGTGVEVYCFMERSLFLCRCLRRRSRESSYLGGGVRTAGWARRHTAGAASPVFPVSGATTADQDSACCCSSSVGDSVSLITTAFVTSMSGCCCLASWIAIARA